MLVTEKMWTPFDSRKWPRFQWVGLVVLLAIVGDWSVAEACGVVARGRRPPAEKGDPYAGLPFLALEQTLIVWDRGSRIEDFVREARFARTGEPFGFVVPVPSRPEVAKVDSPFAVLRKEYPHDPPPSQSRSSGSGKAGGAGGKIAAPPPPVEVLAVERIGSFEVTTLRASDAGALDEWLAKNGFELTDPAKPWLAHYVTLRFYFVAFRYAGAPPGSSDGMTSETVRIRFETGAPYYPYLEPEIMKGAPIPRERRLAVWLVTEEPMIPVVNHTVGDKWTWETPWRPTAGQNVLTANFLARVPALESTGISLRSKSAVVQPFLDVRTNRKNLGDAVFGYRSSHDLDADAVAALRPLLPALDGRIAPGDPDAKPKARACGVTGALDGGRPTTTSIGVVAALGIAIAIGAVRRRRGALALAVLAAAASGAVVACRRASVSDPNERAAVELLSGRPPYTLALAREAKLATTIKLDAPTVEAAGVAATGAIGDSEGYVASCVGISLPPSIDVTIDTKETGRVRAVKASATPALDSAAAQRLESCFESALYDKPLVAPGQVTKVTVHAAVSQDLVD